MASDKRSVSGIWLEFEEWADGEHDPHDDNSDVEVTLDDGSAWAATFLTYANVETLRRQNAESGEALGGGYFWATDLILVDTLTRERVTEVVEHLLEVDEFELIFVPAEDEDDEDDEDA